MKSSLLLLLTISLFVGTIAGSQQQIERYLTTPVFVWAPFSESSSAPLEFPNTVVAEDLKDAFTTLLGLPDSSSSSPSSSLLKTLPSSPELLLVLVHPSLATQDFLGAFPQLGASLRLSEAVLLPNAALEHRLLTPSLLAPLAALQLRAHITSSLAVLADLPFLLDPFAAASSSPASQLHALPLSAAALRDFLALHPSLAANGVTDLLVAYFPHCTADDNSASASVSSSTSTCDALAASLLAAVADATPDAVAVLASERAPAVDFLDFFQLSFPLAQRGVVPPANITGYPSYFPPNVVEGLMTMAILLIILLVGVCCLCYTQTPDRFPDAPREGQANHQILYSHKQ